MKTLFSLSGKKKIFALIAAFITAYVTRDSPHYVEALGFILLSVGGYIFAESKIDRERIAHSVLQSVLYALQDLKKLDATLSPGDLVRGQSQVANNVVKLMEPFRKVASVDEIAPQVAPRGADV